MQGRRPPNPGQDQGIRDKSGMTPAASRCGRSRAICMARIRLGLCTPEFLKLPRRFLVLERLEKAVISSRRTTHNVVAELCRLGSGSRWFELHSTTTAMLFAIWIWLWLYMCSGAASYKWLPLNPTRTEVSRGRSRATPCLVVRPKKLLYLGLWPCQAREECGWAAAPSLVRSSRRLMFGILSRRSRRATASARSGLSRTTLRHTILCCSCAVFPPLLLLVYFVPAHTPYTLDYGTTRKAQVCLQSLIRGTRAGHNSSSPRDSPELRLLTLTLSYPQPHAGQTSDTPSCPILSHLHLDRTFLFFFFFFFKTFQLSSQVISMLP